LELDSFHDQAPAWNCPCIEPVVRKVQSRRSTRRGIAVIDGDEGSVRAERVMSPPELRIVVAWLQVFR
jgi:hypothetical protein